MKLKLNISQLYKGLVFTGSTLIAAACLPESDSKSIDIGDTPEATFTVTPIAGMKNKYVVQSTEPDVFVHRWNFGDGSGDFVGEQTDTAYYPSKGEYTITLLAANANGSGRNEITIDVEEDDPNSCFGKKALLTGCATGESKTWVLLQPEGGALFVGPPGLASAWWSNSEADVTDATRTCMFDDEYTFTKSGGYIFERFGNMRVDDEGGNPWPTDIGLSIGCHDMTEIPEKYQAWGSGNFAFKIIGESKLQVIGTGAHMGLYKVGETGTTAVPESSITYDIVSLTETTLVIKKEYGWGGWRFTFKVKQ
jgi:PKD repeat protein